MKSKGYVLEVLQYITETEDTISDIDKLKHIGYMKKTFSSKGGGRLLRHK